MSDVITLAAETGSSVWPFVIGGGILFILFALVGGLVMFGAGREHS